VSLINHCEFFEKNLTYRPGGQLKVDPMALEISQATSKQSKATWRIYGKLMQSCK
jgi:hypothetical protein